jgi:hypothetical protein
MQVMVNIPDILVRDILGLQQVEQGKVGNYTRLESIVNACRYDVSDKVMTLVLSDINYQLGNNPILHNYSRK